MSRVQRALEGLQGVSKVEFLTDPDRYVVDYDHTQVGFADFERAFKGEIVGRVFRGMLDRGQQGST